MANIRSLLKRYGSTPNPQQTVLEELDRLVPPEGLAILRRMRRDDTVIGGLMWELDGVLLRLKWDITRGSFLEKMLSPSLLRKIIRRAVSFLTYGFCSDELIWQMVGGRVELVDVEPRYQWTIEEFTSDVVRQDSGAEIPLEKCFYVVLGDEPPWGVSILRHAYKPYYYKTSLEASEASGVDRDLAGLPVLQAPEGFNFAAADPDSDIYDPLVKDTLDWALDTVTNIRNDEQYGVVLPYGWELKLLRAEGGSNRTQPSEIIQRYNIEICTGLLAGFLAFGFGTTLPGYGADVLVRNFLAACDTYASLIADSINEQIVKRIYEYNGVEVDGKVSVSKAVLHDLGKLASFVARLVDKEVIKPNDAIERALLEFADLPQGE